MSILPEGLVPSKATRELATFTDTLSAALASAPTKDVVAHPTPEGVRAFQNLAITEINRLVTNIFGTVGVPSPIPPVD
ncbi:hypothetical protein AB0395_40180 [Streptosporangium sp. NPDC051023]|uniref:hypothetical protein n=1 Tax=Streptosporangium sp. NPDC051023 TaxID=3155410 RepID=UPI00344B9148